MRTAATLALLLAAAAANAQTPEYREGWNAYLRQDYATAMRLLVIAADAGDAQAAGALAEINERGLGTPKDPQQAAQWRRLAEELGGGKAPAPVADTDPDYWKKRALEAEKRDWADREALRKQEEARRYVPPTPVPQSQFSWGYSIGGPRYYDPFWGPGWYGYGPGWGPRWGHPHSHFGFGFSQGYRW